MRDETSETELHWFLIPNRLCQTYPPGFHTIDENIYRTFPCEAQVVEYLYQNTPCPHECGGKDEHHDEMTQEERFQPGTGMIEQRVVDDRCDGKRQTIGISHALQVDERRIAHNASIGAEHAETNHRHEDIDHDGTHDAPEVGDVIPRAMIGPEDDES